MTTDAILALLLSVAIPALMALLGAALTISTLDTHNVKRWSWLASFILCFLAAIVLGSIQQVRTTASQTAAKLASEEGQRHLLESQRYTQGQLDSITKVLTSVVSAGGGSDTYQAALKGLLSALPKSSSQSTVKEPASDLLDAAKLSNTELKYKTLAEVGVIHHIEHDADFAVYPLINEVNMEHSYQIAHASWANIRQDCLTLRDELVRRVPVTASTLKPSEQEEVNAALTEGNVSAYYGLKPTAAYLERMALALPTSRIRRSSK